MSEQASVQSERHRAAAKEIYESEFMSLVMLDQSIDPPIAIKRIAEILARHFPVSPAPASEPGNIRLELLEALYDATQKYMQHKNDTQADIRCDDRRMDIRMIYRKDVLNALESLAQPSVEQCVAEVANAVGSTEVHVNKGHDQEWGSERSYVSDDRDHAPLNSLRIMQGGNGDWYVSIAPHGQGSLGKSVRLCTSGGASSAYPGLTVAIADAYRAMGGESTGAAPASEELERLRSVVQTAITCLECRVFAEDDERSYRQWDGRAEATIAELTRALTTPSRSGE